jgi:hypothetical protein
MSIIQEALKKIAEDPKKPEAKTAEAAPHVPHKQEQPIKARSTPHPDSVENQSVRMIYFIAVAVLAAILIGILIMALQMPAPHIKSKKAAAPVLLPKLEPAPQVREERHAQNHGNIQDLGGFILDGIMYIADRPRAIINNIIVGEGEAVDGANVEKINKDNVVLKYNESEVTLKLTK